MLKTTRAVKYSSQILFCLSVFFTTVCFADTWHTPFFLNADYKPLKFALCIIVPFTACFINYMAEKNFVFIGKASAVIMSLFVVFYIIDQLTVKYISCYGSFVIIFHLGYGLVSGFSVFLACTLIKIFTKGKNNHYGSFYNDFFIGFAVMFVFIFILIYFVIRDYSGEKGYTVNLMPFGGELKKLTSLYLLQNESKYSLIRSVGNVFFYTAMVFIVIRFSKKREIFFALAVPVAVSIISEFMQYILNCGDADIDDVISNTFGALIGIVFYKLVIQKLLRSSKC